MEIKKTRNFDPVFYITCAFIILLFSVLTYLEYTSKNVLEGTERTGILLYKSNRIQRKSIADVIWEHLKNRALIFYGDTVRTGENSSAIVSLNDGTRVSMGDNSMIQFLMAEDRLNINFIGGSIFVNRIKPPHGDLEKLWVKINDKVVNIDESDVRIFRDKDIINISLCKGNDIFVSGEKEYLLHGGSEAIIDKDTNRLRQKNKAVNLISPECDKYYLIFTDSVKVGFKWESKSSRDQLEIDDGMRRKLVKNIRDKSADIRLVPAEYRWRIKSYDRASKKWEASEYRKLVIIKDEPVELITPENSSVYTCIIKTPLIDFCWTDNEYSSGYILEISKDSGFENIVRSLHSTDSTISIEELDEGTYYWRVKSKTPFDAIGTPVFKVNQFTIKKTGIFENITLLKPVNSATLVRKKEGAESLIFTCEEYREIEYYKLLISRYGDLENIVVEKESRSNFIIVDRDFGPGRYKWKIEGYLNDKGPSTGSDIRSFRLIYPHTINLITPKENAVFFPENDSARVRFSWDEGGVEGNYQLILYDTDKKAEVYSKSISNAGSAVVENIMPGKYRWYLYYTGDGGKRLFRSNPGRFIIKERLKSPEITAPGKNSVVNIMKINNINFKWKSVEGADIYSIHIFRIEDHEESEILKTESAENSMLLNDPTELGKGDYKFTLQAVELGKDGKKITNQSGVSEIKFSLVRRVLDKPTIKKLEIK